jgi:REP element-mobilizing transposase RayT
MAHRLRQDRPGSWHHVFARGMARRTVFEHVRDIRVFKCLLALECRRGTLEVHALCFMTNHVHLLVRSPTGQLSQALKRVFNGYVRWFNRSRKRDGSLFRGRFGSRPVTSDIDRLNVVAYLDANPVEARLAPTPEAYAHGSATYWAQGKVPPWFSTWFVAGRLGGRVPGTPGAWAAYECEFAPRRGPRLTQLMEARMARRDLEPDPLDDLVAAAPERVYAWMVRKAALADQTRPGIPVVDADTVEETWTTGAPDIRGDLRGRRGPARALASIARVALLRDLAGLRYDAIAKRMAISNTEARTRYRLHAAQLFADPAYAAACLLIARAALDAGHRRQPPPKL